MSVLALVTPPRGWLPRTAAFWLAAAVLGLFMFAASAPSPLYGSYAAAWHFSPSTLTTVFAVYAVALLAALLVTGRLSDHVGRRPVILGSLVLEAAAMACFVDARSVRLLMVARIVQGVATGLATGALSAALIDLQPAASVGLAAIVNSAAPTLGLAAGAMVTSALVEYGPEPLRLVYWLLLVGCALGIAGVLRMPEPVRRRPGALASLRPTAGLPREARGTFMVALPSLVALWALGGLYLSLGPSLTAQLVHSGNHLWGGLVILLLTGVGGAASILLRRWPPPRAMGMGCLMLLAGLALTLVAIVSASAPVFLTGTAVAGFGFGVAFLGTFRTLSSLAAPADRAGLIATIYIVSYLAFSLPVVAAGIAATRVSLHDTAVAYAATLAGLVGLALVGFLVRRTPITPADPVEANRSAGA